MGTDDALMDVRTDWAPLFNGKAVFKTFTHQAWVAHMRNEPSRPAWCDDWLAYVQRRYGL